MTLTATSHYRVWSTNVCPSEIVFFPCRFIYENLLRTEVTVAAGTPSSVLAVCSARLDVCAIVYTYSPLHRRPWNLAGMNERTGSTSESTVSASRQPAQSLTTLTT